MTHGSTRGSKTPRRRSAALGAGLLAGTAVVALAAPLVPVTAPVENPTTEAKRVLGKALFWDEQLSADDTVACGTCHAPAKGGADPRRARHPGADGVLNTADDVFGSPGVIRRDATGSYVPHATYGLDPQVTGRAAPSFLTGAFADSLFWDGRASSQFTDPQTNLVSISSGGALESQCAGPPLSSTEMATEGRTWDAITAKMAAAAPLALASSIPSDVAAVLSPSTRYADLFAAAFGDRNVTAERIAFAVAAYERTLVPDQTPWDRFIAGETAALDAQQTRGWNEFQARKCNDCHEAPEFTDRSFRNIGLRPVAEDRGLQGTTGDTDDRGLFKVPSLRNVGLRDSFMHNGILTTIPDVLRFYARAPGTTQFTDNRDPLMPQIQLPPNVAGDIQALLEAGLTDSRSAAEQFPFDRPALYAASRPFGPAVSGAGRSGTGGVPKMVAVMPPFLGNAEFRLGLGNALAGAQAWVALSHTAPSGSELATETLLGPVTVQGSGGQGYATLHWPVPDDAARHGERIWFQWRVTDGAAAGGVALSPVASATLFATRGTSPIVASSDALLVSTASFALDWRGHAGGKSADSFALRAAFAEPDAALDGTRLVVSLGGLDVVDGVLDAAGRWRSAKGAPAAMARVDDRGRVTVTASGLDLASVTGLDEHAGAGEVALAVVVKLGDATATASVPFDWKTREGRSTAASYVLGRDVQTTAAIGLTSAKVRIGGDGTRSVRVAGAIAVAGGGSLADSESIDVTVGDVTLRFPSSSRTVKGTGAAATVRWRSGAAEFVYLPAKRSFTLSADGLAAAAFETSDTGRSPLVVTLTASSGDARIVYLTTVTLDRASPKSAIWNW